MLPLELIFFYKTIQIKDCITLGIFLVYNLLCNLMGELYILTRKIKHDLTKYWVERKYVLNLCLSKDKIYRDNWSRYRGRKKFRFIFYTGITKIYVSIIASKPDFTTLKSTF